MKKVLSLLLAFVFLQTQTWAIGGGPQGTGGGAALIGTYAGVLVPISQTKPVVVGVKNSAAIGLFVVAVPTTGVAKGAAVAFVDGIAFSGEMTGIADPKKQTLVGIVEGVSRLDVITLVPVVDPLTGAVTFQTIKTKIFAQGNINAKFESSGGGVDPLTGTAGGGSRLSGKASLDLFADLNPNGTPNILNTVSFRVDGFKQSATASAATITFNPVGGG